MTTRDEPTAPATDALVAQIRAQLTDDLLSRREARKPRRTPTAGHCYVASEALWHLTGQTFRVYRIRHEGSSHWFLRTPGGRVVDPTADQFATPVPYDQARHAAFLTRAPSGRTQILVGRVRRAAQKTPTP